MPKLTCKFAVTFVENYTDFNQRGSLSYADHITGSWLRRQVQRFSFLNAAKMNTACRTFLKGAK